MRPSTLSIYELFVLAIRNRFKITGPVKLPHQYDNPKGTELIGFTLAGRDRFETEEVAYLEGWKNNRPVNPVPVFRVVHA